MGRTATSVPSRSTTRSTCSVLGGRFRLARHHTLDLVGAGRYEGANLVVGLAKPAQYVFRHDVRVGALRTAHTDANAAEVRRSELGLERLQAVVPCQAAPETRLNLTERQVDLVVHHQD